MNVDRSKTCPMLIRLEIIHNNSRSGSIYDSYVWKDTTLDELLLQVYDFDPSSKISNRNLVISLWQLDPAHGHSRNKFLAELRNGFKCKAHEYRLEEFGIVAGDTIRIIIVDNEPGKENHQYAALSWENSRPIRRSRSKSPHSYHQSRHYR
jgi:uncharacterized ubiquitin-like protein YukD